MLSLRNLQRFLRDRLALGGIAFFSLLLVAALLAPVARLVSPYDPTEMDLPHRLQGISRAHWMGTDGFGRDVLSRIICGARLSLASALIVTALTAFVGAMLGGLAGYFGGIVDELVMRTSDVLLAFPQLILALAISAVLRPSVENVVLALTATGWVRYSRLVRGVVLSVKEREFVEAARAIGCSDLRILIRHIFPNAFSPILVLATLDTGHVILSISALSFLGLGAQPPTPEWGAMLNEGRPFMQSAPHLLIFPGLMIMLTVLTLNMLGDGLRDALDPYTSSG